MDRSTTPSLPGCSETGPSSTSSTPSACNGHRRRGVAAPAVGRWDLPRPDSEAMMRRRTVAIGSLSGLTAVLLAASVALADTCCANTSVGLDPSTATWGELVTAIGIVCLGPDNSGPLPLELTGFWLSKDHVPADADPGSVPGNGSRLANDLPDDEAWLPFDSVNSIGDAAAGIATFPVPAVPSG